MLKSLSTEADKITAKPQDWKDPTAPHYSKCSRCTVDVRPKYIEPVFWKGRPIKDTGIWEHSYHCPGCTEIIFNEEKKRRLIEAKRVQERKLKDLINYCGFFKIHLDMTLERFQPGFNSTILDEAQKVVEFKSNLFMFGPPGTGKTHIAAGILQKQIEDTMTECHFRIVPELMLEMREDVKNRSEKSLDSLFYAPGLVLDDLGVERPTKYVLEMLYIIIDRWYRSGKKGLTITSNKSLDAISAHLDDRIASRIAGMCEVISMKGEDKRLEIQK